MAKIRPYGNEWFHIPAARDPDWDVINWQYNYGEFSLARLEAFEKNCAKLDYCMHKNPFYAKLNGKKLQTLFKYECLFYGKAGLEELIYDNQPTAGGSDLK